MKASVHLYLLCISLLLALPISVQAQTTFPSADGERAKYAAYIEMPKGYVSGVCVLQRESSDIKGCLFNEFGITALDFTYHPERQKVTLHNVIKMMDKWYIRKVLKKDLRQVMKTLKEGQTEYTNQRRHIVYRFHGIEE